MKKIAASLAALAMVFGLAGAAGTGLVNFDTAVVASAAASNADGFTFSGRTMQNNYLRLVIASDGRYSLYKVDGGRTYNLFYSGTSFQTISLDGVRSKIVGSNVNVAFDSADESATMTYVTNNITITEKFSFDVNYNTGNRDIMKVTTTVTNGDTAAHNVGLRMMFDTQCNNNDEAPFKIPGIGDVTTEREFTRGSIPTSYQAVDSLTNPNVVLTGTFDTTADGPDVVQFISWRKSSNSIWDAAVTPGRSIGDSSVTQRWDEKALAPGQSRVYTTNAGLGEATQQANSSISLVATAPAYTPFDQNLARFANFDVTGTLLNISQTDLNNAYVRIELPDCMSLVELPEDDSSSEADSSSQAEETTSSQAEETTSSQAAEETTSSEAAEETTSSQAAEETTSSQAAEETTSSAAAEETTSSAAAEETTSSEAAEETTSSEATEETASSEAAEETVSSQAADSSSNSEWQDETSHANAEVTTGSDTTSSEAEQPTAIPDTPSQKNAAVVAPQGTLTGAWTVAVSQSAMAGQTYQIKIYAGADGVEQLIAVKNVRLGEPPVVSIPDSSSVADSSSQAASSAAASSAAATATTSSAAAAATDNNPKTGSTALFGAAFLLAAGAIVVSRKK